MDNNHVRNIILSLLILAITWTYGCSNEKAQAQQTFMEKKGKPEVSTVQVALKDFQSFIDASGTLVPAHHAKLTTLVGGKLETIRANIGDHVVKGDILFEVRTVDYDLALRQAKASLKRARVMEKDRKREMKRIENLYSGGSATEQARDKAITALEEALSAVDLAVATRDTAQQALKDCTITAPYDGVITGKYLQEGEFSKSGTPVLEIMDLATLNAEIDVSEQYSGKIGPGTSVTVNPSTDSQPVPGNIVAINPKIDLAGRTFLVKVAVDNTDGRLQAGLFCTARFTLPIHKQQTAIPAAALSHDQGKSTVWIIEGSKAYRKNVTDNGIHDGWAWIVSGLETEQSVVTEGAGSLIDGVEVELID